MRFKLSLVTAFAVVLATSSCITTYYTDVQVLEPAEIAVPQNIAELMLLNRNIYLPADTLEENSAASEQEKMLELLNIASTESIFSLADILNETPRFEFIDTTKILETFYTDSLQEPDPLNPGFIYQLVDSLEADALISLEYISFNDSTRTISRGGRYEVTLYQMMEVLWRIYDGYNAEIIDEHRFVDTLRWGSNSANLGRARNAIPSREEAWMESAYFASLKYGRRIAPHWVIDERMFYSSQFIPRLRSGAGMIDRHRWEDAAEMLIPLTDHWYKPLAAAASFNMAFISEMRGSYSLAIDWLRKALELRDSRGMRMYLEILEERESKKERIDRQIPVQ